MEYKSYHMVDLKVKTVISKRKGDADYFAIALKEFQREHFVSHYKIVTETVLLIFYWED